MLKNLNMLDAQLKRPPLDSGRPGPVHKATLMPSTLPKTRADQPAGPESFLSRRAQWAESPPISYLMHMALARPELISLAAGFVDQQTLPVEPTWTALEALWTADDPRAALQYGTTAGFAPLREQILARHLKADGRLAAETNLSLEQVVITAGSNQLLHLVGDTLFDPGDIVLCAAPSYFVFLGLLTSLGVRAVGVDCDENGLIPEALEAHLARLDAAGEIGRVKAIYVTTYFDNPGNVTLSAERRPEIVAIAKRWSQTGKIHVIEDAAYRELRYQGDDLPSLRAYDEQGDTVIVAGTFSKSYSPGVRVGWGLLPPALVKPLLHQKGNIDFGSPNFAQHLISKVLDLGLFDTHVEQLRQSYRVKLETMLSAADQFLRPLPGVEWLRPSGGLYVWLGLPEHIDTGPSGRLLQEALEQGVLYVPGEYCYPLEGEPVARNMIRLSFGVQSPENIRRGIEKLSEAIRRVG